MKISLSNLHIKKPSLFFFVTLLFSVLFWFLIGDKTWRHVDDYGPLKAIYDANSSIDYLKIYFFGWGSYPPIWEYFTLFSYIFKPLGIDAIRNICLFIGLISLTISSFLTYSICILITQQSRNFNIFEKNYYCIEILSVLFNLLIPQIFLHSNSNMPYNLALITIQLIIILMIVIINNEDFEPKPSIYLFFDNKLLILSTIFGLTLTFQSPIIVFAFFSTILIYFYSSKVKLNLKRILNPIYILGNYNLLFKYFNNKFFRRLIYLSLSFFILTYLLKFFIFAFILKRGPGFWAKGTDDIYLISNFLNEPFNVFKKLIFAIKSIITQSLYPFRISQIEVSFLYLGLLVFAYVKMCRENLLTKYFALFSIFCFIATIGLSLSGKFILSPTRHTIFLYPTIWIPIIINSEKLLMQYKNKIYKFIFLFLLINFYFFGSYFSIKEISYTKIDNNNLINLLKESDFYAPNGYSLFNGDLSLYNTKLNKLTKEKKCQKSLISKLDEFNIFVYSHRSPFLGDEKHLLEKNKECFPENPKISILKKFEKKNVRDIEQNNLISNGGSSLYAYILRVQKK